MAATEVYGVFEGGGVRGTALVGGLAAAEEAEFTFRAVAGTSAGAIVAALLAAGCNAEEMYTLLKTSDLKSFQDGTAGINVLRLWKSMGLHPGKEFLQWMRRSLSQKVFGSLNKNPTFGDLFGKTGVPLTIVTTDVIGGSAVAYSSRDENMPVADAVRRSMSIPFFFEPVRTGTQLFVDGGAVSNFPAWAFERARTEARKAEQPVLPILGFRLQPGEQERPPVDNLLKLIVALGETMAKASLPLQNDRIKGLFTMELPTLGVETTNFGITQTEKIQLYEAGLKAAGDYLSANGDALRLPVEL